MKLLFQNQDKNAPFAILGDELGCVFFYMNIGKAHLNSLLKIGLNIILFPCPSRKNAPFFFVILGITIDIYSPKGHLFFKIKKKRTFCDFNWRIGVRFFFLMNIGKTHLSSSLKIGQNIILFPCPSRKNAPFFFIILGINIEIYIYETSFPKSRKKRTFCDFIWRIGVRFF